MNLVGRIYQSATIGRIDQNRASRIDLNNRTEHVYRRLQVDLKRSKPEAIVAIVVSIVATTFSIVATIFAIVATFVKMLKTRGEAIVATFFTIVATFLK